MMDPHPPQSMYTLLDASLHQIRLLHVPGGKPNDEFNCTLSIASLDDQPEYEALSYVWGLETDTLPIQLQGQTKQVTQNLHSALRGIRHIDRERVLWVDAVCINQKEQDEVEGKFFQALE